MYAICNVIYGWNLSECTKLLEQDAPDGEGSMVDYLEELEDDGTLSGFMFFYNGSGGDDSNPCCFGISLCEFDECRNNLVSELKLQPTSRDKEKLQSMLEKVPQFLREYLTGEPVAFLMWSSS